MRLRKLCLAAISISILPVVVRAAVLECNVARKIGPEAKFYSENELKKWMFSVLIEETVSGASIGRCSFSTVANRVTCDTYQVDRVETDQNVGHKKYYVFRSQFDVQVFNDLTFIENNGRGSIGFGKCRAKAP